MNDIQPVKMLMRREASYTYLRVESAAIRAGVSSKPKTATVLAYALDILENFEKQDAQQVDFSAIQAMTPSQLEIPSWFDCGLRFQTNIALSSALKARLDRFVTDLSKQFPGNRIVYRNLAVTLLWRFIILLEMNQVPVRSLEEEK